MPKNTLDQYEIKFLEGEEEAEILGDECNALLLTNKRMIKLSREGRTSRAMIAFLQDIVAATVTRTPRNGTLLFIAAVLASAGLGWLLYSGFDKGFEDPYSLGGIGGILLGLLFLALYLYSGGAHLVFETAKSDIIFTLGHKISGRAYPFVNRYTELKDIASRSSN